MTVVLLPYWYVAWLGSALCSSFFSVLLTIHIAIIFLSIYKIIIGLKLHGGPTFLPGFCKGISNGLNNHYPTQLRSGT